MALDLSESEHHNLILARAAVVGTFSLPYPDQSPHHAALAAMLNSTWDTLTTEQLTAIYRVLVPNPSEKPTADAPRAGRWIRGYSHRTRGGEYEARERGDGDYDVREPGQEAQRVPGGYFRAEFVKEP